MVCRVIAKHETSSGLMEKIRFVFMWAFGAPTPKAAFGKVLPKPVTPPAAPDAGSSAKISRGESL